MHVTFSFSSFVSVAQWQRLQDHWLLPGISRGKDLQGETGTGLLCNECFTFMDVCLVCQQGKPSAFKEVYSGVAKQYNVTRLMPSTKYAFRLAAKNDVGMRFVSFMTIKWSLSPIILAIFESEAEPCVSVCVFVSSAFSSVLSCCTAGCTASPPPPPPAPQLTESGVTWLCLQWGAPCGSASRDTLAYILEMEETGSVSEQEVV